MLASEGAAGGACCVNGPEVCDRQASSEAKEDVHLLLVVRMLQMHLLRSLHHS